MISYPSVLPEISSEIWERKYRFQGREGVAADRSIQDTFCRVARAAAAVEQGGGQNRQHWAGVFEATISDFGFLPAGRILAGAGTGRSVTLFNCFVLGTIPDDLSGIFERVKDAALTMQAGGGIGQDFSTLRPKGAVVKSIGADASGPVSFMDVWDAMCRTIMSAGQRRGAMMATLRCDHPDIEEFIAAKSDASRLRNFNLSVLVTDAFIAAVDAGAAWPLVFDGKTFKTVDAPALWEKLMRATYDYAEPGVIFIDRINSENNLNYCETIAATNPCGEQPLPPHGACLLGSINLAALVEQPFTAAAHIDTGRLETRVAHAIRLLDNMIGASRYPLAAQADEAHAKRRIGLGVTGLADALIFLGLRYDSAEGRSAAAGWMRTIQNAAYLASAELAREKGAFPLFDPAAFLSRPNIERLYSKVQDRIAAYGIRNGCLTSIAPTGTISLLAGNVSSGIEPVFDFCYDRQVLGQDGKTATSHVEDFAYRTFRSGNPSTVLPPAFVAAGDLKPSAHLAMQAALQPYVDSAISKTINVPENLSFAEFRGIYREAHRLGLKGCTTYRPNSITGSVLLKPAETQAAAQASPAATVQKLETAAVPRTSDVIYMAKPLARDDALQGVTYKINWPGSAHALYVTINDIVADGRRRPFEIFINTKNLEHYAWTVALTRMISAVFRRGGDVAFVAEELKAIFDPEGGRWMNGAYVPSLIAAIGGVIENHLSGIGFITPEVSERAKVAALTGVKQASPGNLAAAAQFASPVAGARICPRCGNRSLMLREGCWMCATCLYSRCS